MNAKRIRLGGGTRRVKAAAAPLAFVSQPLSAGPVSLLALAVGLGLVTVAAAPAAGQALPTGGQVAAGLVTIGQPAGGQMTVRQASDRSVVNWQTFNVGAGGRVDFQQPSASSATLNRVSGNTGSVIAGQISANGQVFLVNPNGIQITPSGAVRTGAFVASTLDIKNSDFLAGRTVFEGNGRSAGVVNQGTIEAAPGGSVVLMGGRVVNEGTITAHGGRVGLASGERVVVDLQGDGFLQVSVPTADADRTEALIKHTGRIQANGGRVAMRAATTADVARAAITVSGTIEARTVVRTDAGVVFGTDAGAPPIKGPATVQRGKVEIDGGPGGSVTTSGRITASSGTQRGGDISISGGSVKTTGTLDVSGGTVGGTITVDGGTRLDASGIFLANGGSTGGRIDLTADDVRVTQASLSATGGDVGGLIRVGGAFQGGSPQDNTSPLQATFVTRWADAPALRNATETRVGSSASIDVSGGSTGGTAVVWANGNTWMNGSVKATGALSAGSVEISGKENLAYIDLAKLEIGAGGQLLLDPKNLVIDSTGSTNGTTGANEYGDNADGTNTIAATVGIGSLTATLNTGASVTLSAINDISVLVGWSANGNGSSAAGNLTLQAGRSVLFTPGITINTDSGNLTVIANANNIASSTFGTGRREAGAAIIDMRGTTVNAGTGAVTLIMQEGSKGGQLAGDVRLGVITTTSGGNSQDITVQFASTATSNVELNGNLTSGDNIVLPDRNIIVRANSVLTSGSGDSIIWAGEGTKTITGAVGGETIRFVEGSTLTRIGVMDTADAARLNIGPSGNVSRPYGDPNTVVTSPALASGSLRAGDTLAALLAANSTTITWGSGGAPSTTANAGTSRTFSVSDNAGIAFASGKRGYFLNPATVTGTLTVAQRPITVTADPKSKIYGDADPALTYQITAGNLVNGDTIGGALTRVSGSNVGAYAINKGTLAATSNYAMTFVGGTFIINQRPITVTADAKTKVYGDADPALTWQITSGNLVGGDTLGGSLSRVPGSNVGTYAINKASLNNNNYAITYVGANFTITPAPLNVTANALSKIYGDADPTLTYANSGLRNGDSASVITGGLSRASGQNAGVYAINQGTLSAGGNYTINFTGANFTIDRAPLNVTANTLGKIYGDIDPALTFSATGFRFTDTAATGLTGALARAPGETVAGGPYAINQGSLAAANYTITFTGANFTINKRPITVTADAKTKIYGDADPALTFTTSSLGTGVAVNGVLARSAGETVAGGPYAITQGTVTDANNPNYAITYVGADLTIGRAPLNVTANALGKVYGDADPALTFNATGFRFTDAAVTALTGALARASGETVAGGPYAINQGSLAAANYTITFTGANFTVNQRPITVTADAKSKIYGNADPALTYQITSGNLVGIDTLAGGLTRNAGENVGAYVILQGSLSNSNYAITYVGSNLTVNQRPITVTADAKNKVYGNADPALTYQITSGNLVGADTLAGALARNAGETVGAYAILQGSLSNSNYAITYVGNNLTVTQRPVTVTADAKSKVYGDADPALTYQITSGNLVGADTLAGGLSRNPGENVGAYGIVRGTLDNPNYAITYAGNNLTVTPAVLNVVADAKGKIYGDADPFLTFAATGFKFTDTAGTVLSGGLSRAPGENVGFYAIGQGSLAANGNYTINYTGANLLISQATLHVVANGKTKVYGDADPALTFLVTGFRSGDTASILAGGLARNPGETVGGGPVGGAYFITAGTLSAGGNYVINYTGNLFTITPAPLNVVANARTKVYGDADPALTFAASGFKFTDTAGGVLTGGLARAPGETVAGGPYAINQGTLAVNANYTINYTPANLTITPAVLNVVAQGKTKVYGDADPALTFVATGFRFDDRAATVLSGGLRRTPGESVAGGPYAINQGSLAANPNYTIAYIGAGLAITPAPLSVVANARTKVYGDADPALTFTASGFRFADTVATVLSGGLTRAAGETVLGGPYAIGQGSLAANANYTLAYTPAVLAITPRPLTVTADNQTKITLAPDPVFTWQVTAGNVVFGDTPTGALARSSSSDAPGTYPITQGTFSLGSNYALHVVEGVLTIQPRPTGPLPGITVVGATLPGASGNGPVAGLHAGGLRSATLFDVGENGEQPEAPAATACKINKQGTLICGTF